MEHSEEMVVQAARSYMEKHGRLPSQRSGDAQSFVIATPFRGDGENIIGLTWGAIDAALRRRGLSLSQLLRPEKIGSLTPDTIIRWARVHKRKHDKYPSQLSGTECLPKGWTWAAINSALVHGHRGLPGRQSLSQLMQPLRDECRIMGAIDGFTNLMREADPVQMSRTSVVQALGRLARLLNDLTDETGK